jgi:hypothetical protein
VSGLIFAPILFLSHLRPKRLGSPANHIFTHSFLKLVVQAEPHRRPCSARTTKPLPTISTPPPCQSFGTHIVAALSSQTSPPLNTEVLLTKSCVAAFLYHESQIKALGRLLRLPLSSARVQSLPNFRHATACPNSQPYSKWGLKQFGLHIDFAELRNTATQLQECLDTFEYPHMSESNLFDEFKF